MGRNDPGDYSFLSYTDPGIKSNGTMAVLGDEWYRVHGECHVILRYYTEKRMENAMP